MNYPSFAFSTAKGELHLTCVDWREPNNGRMLYEVKLMLNENDLTRLYFDDWNFINCRLDRYAPMSDDKKWIYIPKESSSFLINAETLQKITLPYIEGSAATFMGNFFIGDYLVVISTEKIISKNLKTGTKATLNKPTGNYYFKDVQPIDKNTIAIYLANGAKGIVSTASLQTVTKETNDYDFGRLGRNILRLILRKFIG